MQLRLQRVEVLLELQVQFNTHAIGKLNKLSQPNAPLASTASSSHTRRCGACVGRLGLTDAAIVAVSSREDPTVFILWGADAQAKRPFIDETRHLVIDSAHPSPLSARRGFFGSQPFSRANAFLRERGRGEIDWTGA